MRWRTSQKKVDVEGDRFDARLSQDRAEGGGNGFVMSANNLGDSYFAREQAEGKRNETMRARAVGWVAPYFQPLRRELYPITDTGVL